MASNRSGLADALFSKVQQRVLDLLFGRPDQSFYLNELIRLAGSGTGAVQRELQRLADSGLVTVTRVGHQKHFRANRDSPIFDDLHRLVLKTTGLVAPLQTALAPQAKKIKAAFVYGSIAAGRDTAASDIDLMVIGNGLVYRDMFVTLQHAENDLGRRVSPNILTPADWRRKLDEHNGFISGIVAQPKLFVFGSDDDLAGTR